MLDHQVRCFLDRLRDAGVPPVNTLTPDVARALHAVFVGRLAGPLVPVHDVRDRDIPGPLGRIPIRIYAPATPRPAPVLIYFHGGGYVVGDLAMADEACRRITNAAGCIVVSVAYRLAPEFPYPAPIGDAFAATRWVSDHAVEIGGDGTRIAVGGDSAGGALAAVVSLMARDRGAPSIVFQLLVYPAVDSDDAYPSLQQFGTDHYLTLETMRWFRRHHVPVDEDESDPYLWPMRAAHLRGLPRALVITAEADPLRDAAEAYARRLAADGVPARLSRYDGMLHGFFLCPSAFDRARDALDEAACALREAFATSPPT